MYKELDSPKPELESLAEGLENAFFLRRDLYARQCDDGSYICIKKPLTLAHITRHLQGDITLGAYLLNLENQTRFLVFDADDDQQFSRLRRAAVILETQGATPYLEQSRRGGHLWLFFYQPILGSKARSFGKCLVSALELSDMEMFPKQDKLKDGPGSLIRLPFGIHRRSGERYNFLTPSGNPIAVSLAEQIHILSAPKTLPKHVFMSYLGVVSSERQNTEISRLETHTGTLSQRIKGSIHAQEFIGRYVDLSPNGVGLCPFHDDHHHSFAVSSDGNYWHCFAGCGGGSIIDFWMKRQNCDFRTAIKELAAILLV